MKRVRAKENEKKKATVKSKRHNKKKKFFEEIDKQQAEEYGTLKLILKNRSWIKTQITTKSLILAQDER